MAKRGFTRSSLQGLRSMAVALTAMKAGHVDVGFFAGDASRNMTQKQATDRAARLARYTGGGSKEGFFKQGVEFTKRREQVAHFAKEEPKTNPEIAAKHEFGIGVPKRSMLRMPLHLHGDKVLKDAQSDAKSNLKTVSKNPKATAKRLLARVGAGAYNVVSEAFATGGYGNWKPNAPSTIALKGSSAPLIDTAQLRQAVAYRTVI